MPGKPIFLSPTPPPRKNYSFYPDPIQVKRKKEASGKKADFINKITVFLCSAMDRDGSAKLEKFHNHLRVQQVR